MELKENAIEWVTGSNTVTMTLTQKKYINRIKRLGDKFPEEVVYTENRDGSVCARLPLKALKIYLKAVKHDVG